MKIINLITIVLSTAWVIANDGLVAIDFLGYKVELAVSLFFFLFFIALYLLTSLSKNLAKLEGKEQIVFMDSLLKAAFCLMGKNHGLASHLLKRLKLTTRNDYFDFLQAKTEVALGNPETARAYFIKLLDNKFMGAACFAELEKFSTEEERKIYFEKARKASSESEAIMYAYLKDHIVCEEDEKALSCIKKLQKSHPTTRENLSPIKELLCIKMAAKKRNPESALTCLQRIGDPKHFLTKKMEAELNAAKGKKKQAAALFQELMAEELDADIVRKFLALGGDVTPEDLPSADQRHLMLRIIKLINEGHLTEAKIMIAQCGITNISMASLMLEIYILEDHLSSDNELLDSVRRVFAEESFANRTREFYPRRYYFNLLIKRIAETIPV